ncbi:MAG: NAD(P)/FAD-dependent oxidoreductase [Halomonadaceae bacterium]|nr:MAG: NAD(P)/FAD-dependent oxidoreductase [Halomonadaceae bacterium]
MTASTTQLTPQRLVIIGHGMAAQRLLQSLVAEPAQPWAITVIGEEPETAYNRILLSPLLAGEADSSSLPLCDQHWYQQHQIHCISGDPVTAIDPQAQQVSTASGQQVGYDRLVLATGSRPALPPLPGVERPGIQGFRTLEDTRALQLAARQGGHALVVGGGFLGLEAAEGLRKQGMQVTLLHRSSHLLNRQLDATAGQLLAETLQARGLNLRLETQVAGFHGKDAHRESPVAAVELTSGETLAADLVVIATGIRPNSELAAAAGLVCDRAVVVDQTLTTSNPHIHALGECCQFHEHTFGLVDPVNQQADVLAAHLLGQPAHYHLSEQATRLKISGIELFSCGQVVPAEGTESITYYDREQQEYRHLLLRDNRLVGAVLYGDARTGPWLFRQLRQGADLTPWRELLVFGEAHCGAAAA